MAGLVLTLFGFTYLQLSGVAVGFVPGALDARFRFGLAIAALLLASLIVLLFGLGWSWSKSLAAVALAGGVALFGLSVAAGWRLNFAASAASARELWRPQASTVGLGQLVETIEAVSQSQSGRKDGLVIQTLDPPTPALAWSLRSFDQVSTKDLDSFETPPVILAVDVSDGDQLRADYFGQTFVIGERWGWAGSLPPDSIAWWIKRRAPTLPDSWMLLVRAGLAGFEALRPAEAEEESEG